MPPQQSEQEPRDSQRNRVQHDRELLLAIPTEQRRGKRQERNAQQKQQVQLHERPVMAPEIPKGIVMRYPVGTDHYEAEHVA